MNESAALGLLPPPPPVANTTLGKGTEEEDEWVDIRTVDFAAVYTEEYGDEWMEKFPVDLAAWEGLDKVRRRVKLLRKIAGNRSSPALNYFFF